MSSWTPPTVAEFKAQFVRDFPYAPASAPNDLGYVTDTDIQSAINEAQVNFNPVLFGANTTIIFMYLAAHTMVTSIRNSTLGLSSQSKFLLQSANVGSVSLTNNVSEIYAQNPMFSALLTTGYGQKYLDMVYPYTIGNVHTDLGRTTFA